MGRRTIGKRWPRSAPDWDRPARCDYCGVPWRLSQMWVDGSGLLVCPKHGNGRDAVTLSRLNAEHAARTKIPLSDPRPGAYYDINSEDEFGYRSTREHIKSTGSYLPDGTYLAFSDGSIVTSDESYLTA